MKTERKRRLNSCFSAVCRAGVRKPGEVIHLRRCMLSFNLSFVFFFQPVYSSRPPQFFAPFVAMRALGRPRQVCSHSFAPTLASTWSRHAPHRSFPSTLRNPPPISHRRFSNEAHRPSSWAPIPCKTHLLHKKCDFEFKPPC